jgi:hypothetical protein
MSAAGAHTLSSLSISAGNAGESLFYEEMHLEMCIAFRQYSTDERFPTS